MSIIPMPVWANVAAAVAVLVIIANQAGSLYKKRQASQEKKDEIINVKNIILAVIAIAEGCFFLYKYPVEANFWLGLIDFVICVITACLACAALCDNDVKIKPLEATFMCLFSAAGMVMMMTLLFANLTIAAIWLASVVILALISIATK